MSRLQTEHIMVKAGRGMTIFLPRIETDHNHVGTTHRTSALLRLCLVVIYETWSGASGLVGGLIFRWIDRWGRMADDGLQASGTAPLLCSLFRDADLIQVGSYGGHSLRHGFATWASGRGGRDS